MSSTRILYGFVVWLLGLVLIPVSFGILGVPNAGTVTAFWIISPLGLLLAWSVLRFVRGIQSGYQDGIRVARHGGGKCLECGYDLRASTTEVCPECGSRILPVVRPVK